MTVKVLADGTTYRKAHAHNWEDPNCLLKGLCQIYIKLDGVRAIRNKAGGVWSRDSKPLYNCDHLQFKDAEIFRKNWNESHSITSSSKTKPTVPLTQEDAYELTDGMIDPRLNLGWAKDPSNENLEKLMLKMLELGHEGLIVRCKDKKGNILWWKIVPYKYADVKVIGYKEGKGALAGTIGSLKTNYGSVGSFCDGCIPGIEGNIPTRNYIMKHIHQWIADGQIIQARYRETTDEGKLRFAALFRVRTDKSEESLD